MRTPHSSNTKSKIFGLFNGGKFPFPTVGMLCILLAFFLSLECFVPLGRIVQIGADEGFELAKATLVIHRYELYSEVWNDQPPLHTMINAKLLKFDNSSVISARLLTVCFACLLLSSNLLLITRMHGLLIASIATTLLIASPGFLELTSSVMLEIPSLAIALAGLCSLCVAPRSKWFLSEIVGGTLFGAALLTKLLPAVLLPLALLILWCNQSCSTGKIKFWITRSLVFICAIIAGMTAIDFLIEGGRFLLNFQQSWTSHFGHIHSLEYGSPDEHPFECRILLKNWDTTVPAMLGTFFVFKNVIKFIRSGQTGNFSSLKVATRRMSRRKPSSSLSALPENASPIFFRTVFPSVWLSVVLLVFASHKPWWPYYYVHIAIPLCWCAAIGFRTTAFDLSGPKKTAKLALVGVFVVCALTWITSRLWLELSNLRALPKLSAALAIKEIKRFGPVTKFLFAETSIYSFYANIPMPPRIAVLPFKRFWAGAMSNEQLAEELALVKPGIILIPNDGREVPYMDLINREYQLVYYDAENRLYVHKAIADKARD